MKHKILIRAAMLPNENIILNDVLKNDYIWSNSGNLLFSDSIIRALSINDDIEFTKIGHRNKYDIDPDYVNSNFESFIIPLANAFRIDFDLTSLTKFIQKLRIPCVVIGVGLQGEIDTTKNNNLPFDSEVREFCYAVLDKSTTIGVRGNLTHNYLTNNIGIPANYIDIIGCPSMYYYGDNFYSNKNTFTNYISNICTNLTREAPYNVINYINNIWDNFEDSKFICQKIEEGRLLIWGDSFKTKLDFNYPNNKDHILFKNKRMIFFINSKEWIEYLSNMNFSIGTRIHGTIAAVLAGIPVMLIAIDSRTLELAQYHKIPYILAKDVNDDYTLHS